MWVQQFVGWLPPISLSRATGGVRGPPPLRLSTFFAKRVLYLFFISEASDIVKIWSFTKEGRGRLGNRISFCKIFYLLHLFYVDECFVCTYVSALVSHNVWRDQKEVLDPLEVELWMVSHYVNAGNPTLVHWAISSLQPLNFFFFVTFRRKSCLLR